MTESCVPAHRYNSKPDGVVQCCKLVWHRLLSRDPLHLQRSVPCWEGPSGLPRMGITRELSPCPTAPHLCSARCSVSTLSLARPGSPLPKRVTRISHFGKRTSVLSLRLNSIKVSEQTSAACSRRKSQSRTFETREDGTPGLNFGWLSEPRSNDHWYPSAGVRLIDVETLNHNVTSARGPFAGPPSRLFRHVAMAILEHGPGGYVCAVLLAPNVRFINLLAEELTHQESFHTTYTHHRTHHRATPCGSHEAVTTDGRCANHRH